MSADELDIAIITGRTITEWLEKEIVWLIVLK